MAGRSATLADRFDMEIQRAVVTLEQLSDADWHEVTAAEGWRVGVTAHHFAGALEPISQLIEGLVAGRPGTLSRSVLDTMNAEHAKDYVDCTKAETIAPLRRGAAVASRTIRGLTNAELAKSGTVLTDMPQMSVEQLIGAGLLSHIEEHFGSIRATVGR
jgi:Mycothiol maleylpyruvate isomerase N-terminal domain